MYLYIAPQLHLNVDELCSASSWLRKLALCYFPTSIALYAYDSSPNLLMQVAVIPENKRPMGINGHLSIDKY